MTRSKVTPILALKRLADIVRQLDAHECPALYNQIQGELAVADMTLRDWVEPSMPRLPSTPEEVLAFIGVNFESFQVIPATEGSTEDFRVMVTGHDLLSSFQAYADQAEEAQPAVVAAPEAVAHRTEEIRKMLANPEAIKHGKLVWAAECLLAHIALTNNAAPQPEAAQGDVVLKAARYDWLRHGGGDRYVAIFVDPDTFDTFTGNELDAAVDALMAKEKQS